MTTTTVNIKRQAAPADAQDQPARKIHFRRAHKKSHLGCANCKQRRIKCDEHLPICTQCTKSNAQCSYLSLTSEQIAERKLQQQAANPANSASSTQQPYTKQSRPPLHNPLAAQRHLQQDTASTASRSSPSVYSNIPPPQTRQPFYPAPSAGTPQIGTSYGSLPPVSQAVIGHGTPTPTPATTQPPVTNGNGNRVRDDALKLLGTQSNTENGIRSIVTPSDSSVDTNTVNSVSDRTGSSVGEHSIVMQGFETEMIRNVYYQWMSSVYLLALENANLYHAIMSLSYGILNFKSQDRSLNSSVYTRESSKHRFIAVHELQQIVASNKPVDSPEALLATALILSWDIFFQEEDISSYVTLSKGFVAVLERTLTMSMTQPNNTVLCMSDSLFQGIKAVQIPPYSRDVLEEILQKLDSFREYFASTPGLESSNILAQYSSLASFLRDVSCYLLTAKRIDQSNGIKYFPPMYLISLLRRWVRMFPAKALAMGVEQCVRQLPEQAVVLYCYYHATTRVLDALFPEMRYLFQFGFIGPIELVGIEGILNIMDLGSITPFLEFPKKIISFFRERLFHYNRLIGNRNPLTPDGNPLEFTEIQIRSFEKTVIGPEHFPNIAQEAALENDPTRYKVATSVGAGYSGSSNLALLSSVSGADIQEKVNPQVDLPPTPDSSRQPEIFQAYFQDRMKILESLE